MRVKETINKEMNQKMENMRKIKKEMAEVKGKIEALKEEINQEIIPGSYSYDVEKVEKLQKQLEGMNKKFEQLQNSLNSEKESYKQLNKRQKEMPTKESIELQKNKLNEELLKVNEELKDVYAEGSYQVTEEMQELERKRADIKNKLLSLNPVLKVLADIETEEQKINLQKSIIEKLNIEKAEIEEEKNRYVYGIPNEVMQMLKENKDKLKECKNRISEYEKNIEKLEARLENITKTVHIQPELQPETQPEPQLETQPRKQIEPDAKNIKIQFVAKKDAYVVENLETREKIWINRKDIKETDKEILAQKAGKNLEDLEYVDTNILKVLMNYNKDIARKYFKEVTTMGKSKENRLKDMKSIGLEINYDLRGLYGKHPGDELDSKSVDEFSLEERRFLLDNANKSNEMGCAKVKKGLKVKIFEKIDQFRMKFARKKLLDMGKIKDYSNDKEEISDSKEELSDEDKKKLKRLIKIKTKEVVHESYGLQQDVLDMLEEINDPYPEEVRKRREEQRNLKNRVQVDDETKEKLDEVVEQHKEEETKSEEPHRLTPDEYEVIESDSERE